MALRDEDIRTLVSCQTQQDSVPADRPFLATDRRGNPAVVPPGERWLLHVIDCENTDTAAAEDAYVWIVPRLEPAPTAASTRYLRIPGISVAATITEIREPVAGGKVIDTLDAGDAIWVMGGGTAMNIIILGWRVRAG